jgi:hypothetical protein
MSMYLMGLNDLRVRDWPEELHWCVENDFSTKLIMAHPTELQ